MLKRPNFVQNPSADGHFKESRTQHLPATRANRVHASFREISSSRMSRTVSGTITLPVFLKKEPISLTASELKSNDTKKPLVRFSRVITASKESMSGRPALSFCLTWIGYQWSMKSSSPACLTLLGTAQTGKMRPSMPMSPTWALFGMPRERDDGPVLELERRHLAQLLLAARQVAHHEIFPLGELAHVLESLGHDAAGGGRDIDADRRRYCPLVTSHTLTVLSVPADANRFPSGPNATL